MDSLDRTLTRRAAARVSNGVGLARCTHRLITLWSFDSGLVESSRLRSRGGPSEQQLPGYRVGNLDPSRGAAGNRLLESGSPPARAASRPRPLALRTVNAPVRGIETPLSTASGKGASSDRFYRSSSGGIRSMPVRVGPRSTLLTSTQLTSLLC